MAGSIIRKKVTGFISLLLLLSLTITAFRCDEEKDPEFVFMAFVIPISIFPQTDHINIGSDTLWIDGSFPDTLLEYHSNVYYKLSNFDFKSSLCLKELVNNQNYISDQPSGFNKLKVVNIIGGVNQSSSNCGDFNFVYENERYWYKIGIIGNTSGVFALNFLWPIDLHGFPEEQIDLRPVINLGKSADGRKRIPVYEAFYFVINDGETNFELFKKYCRAASLENPAPINFFYEQKGAFTFRVVK